MNGNNGTLYEKRADGKFVELFIDELDLFRTGNLRQHKQPPCRFEDCQQDWYLSERKNAYHSRQMVVKEDWRWPTSCPMHRDISKIRTIANLTELCKKTGKRTFKSQTEADTFAEARTSNNGAPLQHSYECGDCGGFHLSSMTPEQQTALESSKAAGSPSTILSDAALNTVKPFDQDTQICQLFKAGKRAGEIGAQVGMHHLSVIKVLRQHGLWTTKTSPLTTIALEPQDLDAQLAQAQRRVEELQRQKQVLAEAKKLRVEMVGEEAFMISKEGEHATLPLTELEPLIHLLMNFMQERTPNHVVQAVATLTA